MDESMKTQLKAIFRSDRNLVEFIQKAPSGKTQKTIIEFFETEAARNGMQTGGMPTLGDVIMGELSEKVATWGAKTFPLSENQLDVIVSELEPWRK